jgi:hypothetical protein
MGTRPPTSQTEERLEERKKYIVDTILQPNTTFHITPSMLCMEEIVGQTP